MNNISNSKIEEIIDRRLHDVQLFVTSLKMMENYILVEKSINKTVHKFVSIPSKLQYNKNKFNSNKEVGDSQDDNDFDDYDDDGEYNNVQTINIYIDDTDTDTEIINYKLNNGGVK